MSPFLLHFLACANCRLSAERLRHTQRAPHLLRCILRRRKLFWPPEEIARIACHLRTGLPFRRLTQLSRDKRSTALGIRLRVSICWPAPGQHAIRTASYFLRPVGCVFFDAVLFPIAITYICRIVFQLLEYICLHNRRVSIDRIRGCASWCSPVPVAGRRKVLSARILI